MSNVKTSVEKPTGPSGSAKTSEKGVLPSLWKTRKSAQSFSLDLPIKKTAARAKIAKKKGVEKPKEIKDPITMKKVPAKKSLPNQVPKKPAVKKPAQSKSEGLKVVPAKKNEDVPRANSLKGSYKILHPDYAVLAFMDIYSDNTTLENMIKTLKFYNIEFAFANIAEGTNIRNHKEFQEQNNNNTEKNKQIKRAILDFADPEKSGIATPHLQNDLLVFKVSSAKDRWLLGLLETVRDMLAIDNIDTMVTMSIEDDGPSESIVQNVLIIGFA